MFKKKKISLIILILIIFPLIILFNYKICNFERYLASSKTFGFKYTSIHCGKKIPHLLKIYLKI